LFVRRFQAKWQCTNIFRGDLFGSRELKYRTLGSTLISHGSLIKISPSSPLYLFAQQDQANRREFELMPLLSEVTQLHSVGVVTARDHLTIAFTPDEIWNRVQKFV
jgi:hypothetical protein